MDTPKKSIETIQSDVCNTTLFVMAWLVIPALMISLSRALEIGWRLQYITQAIAAVIIWGITAFRHRLGYTLRANTILALLFWMGWTGQIATTAPTAFVYFVAAGAMAAVFYGTRGGILAIALSVVITASSYLAIKAGFYPTPTYAAGMSITTWASRAASVAIAAAGPVITISQLSRELTKELARSEAASEAKSSFLAMMSHELRTPMTAVIGIAELLQHEPLTAGQAQKVGRIATAGKNLLALLNDVLDFAKLQAAQMAIDNIAFSVSDVLTDVQDLFTPLAAEKGLTIGVENAVTDNAVMGDPARLRQILQNLVGNAIKFTETGHIAIAARQTIVSGQVRLIIDVRDNGIGIDPADQARLFRPFVQSENYRTRRRGGTGLGLAISRRIAGLMKGDLTVTSELGKGSTFTLTLPAAIAPEGAVTRGMMSERLGPARGTLRILLAEDNDAIRDLMVEMLAKRNHAVDAVVNGLEALKAVQVGLYDVIIMDMHMPVMDGAEATHLIRTLDGPQAKIPIVALTAGLTEDQRASYMAAGVDQIVAKPAHWPTLFEAIETRGLTYNAASGVRPLLDAKALDDTAKPLDEAALSALAEAVGEPVLAPMLMTFRDSVGRYLEQIETALKAGDLTAARRAGHGLKGTSLQFGANALAAIAAAIENAATLPDAIAKAPELTPALAKLDTALAARARTTKVPAA